MDQMFDRTAEPLINPKAGGDTCIPMFKMEPVEDKAESLKQGHKVYADREMVEIIIPGDKHNIPKHFVTNEHRNRWPNQYAQFKKGQKQTESGTPVELWPVVGPSEVKMLKASDIHSVEVLAAYPEGSAPKIPHFFVLQKKARDWLSSAAGTADVVRMGAELREAQEKLIRLETRNAELLAALNAYAEQGPAEEVPTKRKYTKRSVTDLPRKHA